MKTWISHGMVGYAKWSTYLLHVLAFRFSEHSYDGQICMEGFIQIKRAAFKKWWNSNGLTLYCVCAQYEYSITYMKPCLTLCHCSVRHRREIGLRSHLILMSCGSLLLCLCPGWSGELSSVTHTLYKLLCESLLISPQKHESCTISQSFNSASLLQ